MNINASVTYSTPNSQRLGPCPCRCCLSRGTVCLRRGCLSVVSYCGAATAWTVSGARAIPPGKGTAVSAAKGQATRSGGENQRNIRHQSPHQHCGQQSKQRKEFVKTITKKNTAVCYVLDVTITTCSRDRLRATAVVTIFHSWKITLEFAAKINYFSTQIHDITPR